MKVGKPTSKRTPVRLRHKIQKASAAKQKKARKEAKKNPQWQSRLKKDPGIPNLFPYKARILADIEEGRRRKEEEAQQRREIAKAQRQGKVGTASGGTVVAEANDTDDVVLENTRVDNMLSGDEMEVQDESNPMAALLASAQARAQAYSKDDADEDDEDTDEEEDDNDEWAGIDEGGNSASVPTTRKALPKQALADPIKAVTILLSRLQETQDGIQMLIEHYELPPLVTAGSDTSTRFLVDVARKRGRLGRGGIPNLRAAALIVLSDWNEGKLRLPGGVPNKAAAASVTNKSAVQIVSQMAEPFRIEGLFGNDENNGEGTDGYMAVEA